MFYIILLAIAYILVNIFIWQRAVRLLRVICSAILGVITERKSLREAISSASAEMRSARKSRPSAELPSHTTYADSNHAGQKASSAELPSHTTYADSDHAGQKASSAELPSHPSYADSNHPSKLFYAVAAVFTAIYLFLMSSIITWTAFSDQTLAHWFKFISNVWIGIFIYSLFFIALAEILTLILRALKKVGRRRPGWNNFVFFRGMIVVLLIVGISVYGTNNRHNIRLTEYSVDVDKHTALGQNMKIVLIADTHIGYSVDKEQIDRMVSLVNKQNPDLVVMAGDIIDNDYNAMENPDGIAQSFSNIKSKYGVYACYGNHDVYEKLVGGFEIYEMDEKKVQDEVDDFIANCKINMLEDEVAQLEDIYIIGRVDESAPNGLGETSRKTIDELTADLDKDSFIIDIDHEPTELSAKATAGVDLDLGGHTHNGQIFPGNLLMEFFWENPWGLKDYGDMHSVVTSGIGVWGPAMRVGANPEVTVVNVNFTK